MILIRCKGRILSIFYYTLEKGVRSGKWPGERVMGVWGVGAAVRKRGRMGGPHAAGTEQMAEEGAAPISLLREDIWPISFVKRGVHKCWDSGHLYHIDHQNQPAAPPEPESTSARGSLNTWFCFTDTNMSH